MKTTAAALLLALARARSASAAVEWAGAFPLDDATHQWSMQADADGNYPDASMRIVVVPTDTPGKASIEAAEESATAMIDGDDCPDYQSGTTLPKPAEGGTCYNLVVDPAADSLWTLETDGLTGASVFAQHVPIEFERDMHYLKDSEGTDIEPAHEEGGDGHAHDHGGHGDEEAKKSGTTCADEAEKLGFEISCAERQLMLDSHAYLKSNGCADDCSSDMCVKHYFIVQAHHDHCGVNDIPPEIEDGFHDFDTECTACEISRQYVAGAPDCPAPQCETNVGNDAYVALIDQNCAQDCASDACRDSFFQLRSTHDLCDHEVLTQESEEGLHDYEDHCIVHVCNAEGAAPDGGDGHDHAADHEDEDKADAGTEADAETEADTGAEAEAGAEADAGTESKEGDTSGAAAAGSLLMGVVSGLAMLF